MKKLVTRYTETENKNGLGFSNGIACSEEGEFVSYSDYIDAIKRAEIAEDELQGAQGQIADALWMHDKYTWKPIETIPKDGTEVLTMRSNGWIAKAVYYDNPFGRTDTVIENKSGKWWSASYWIHVPDEFHVDVYVNQENPA